MELELQYTELSCCEAGESVTLTQEEALSNAPDSEDGRFKVPAILEED